MTLRKGSKVAGYRIEGVLGRGGMGVVYEATHLYLERPVALKLISPELTQDEGFRERFRREGRIQAGLEHPHIVSVYEAAEAEEGLYLAIRLVDGPSLKELIDGKKLSPKRTLSLLRPLAEALDFAHGKGLIHRDLKPQNILVGPNDHAYLADFGLTFGPSERTLTKTGQLLGTVDYISPEQVEGKRATAQSDIYSLTAVLYEALTGSVPFPKDSEAAVVFAHMSEDPPRVSDQVKGLPAAIDQVVQQGLAKKPKDRYKKATKLVGEASEALDGAAPRKRTVAVSAVQDAGKRAKSALRPKTESVPAAPRVARGGTTAEDVSIPAKPERKARQPKAETTTRQRSLPQVPGRLAISVGLTALAAIGFFLGGLGSGESVPSLNHSASVAGLGVSFPSGWTETTTGPDVPGMSFQDPVRLEQADGGGLVAGNVAASGKDLLPATFIQTLGGTAPEKEPVELDDLTAYRYSGLQPSGFASMMDLYVVPTGAGVATLACFGPDGSGAVPSDCGPIAESLKIVGTKSFPVGPDEGYANRINDLLGVLNTKRTSGRAELSKASTQSAQANAAGDLEAAFSDAANGLPTGDLSPEVVDANAAIKGALEGAAAAYADLGTAAGSGSSASYGVASAAVRKAEAAVVSALNQLKDLGYKLEG